MDSVPTEVLFQILDFISDSDCFHLALSSKPICKTLLENCKLQADIRNPRWVAAMERAMCFSVADQFAIGVGRNTLQVCSRDANSRGPGGPPGPLDLPAV